MGTLHIDFVVLGFHGHANWIEAYHLLDGIGQFLILDGGCDAEVLQFVVEEVDDVGRLLVVQLEQGLAERHIIVFTIYVFTIYYLLRLSVERYQHERKDEQ